VKGVYSSIAPRVLNISAGEVSGTFHTLTALSPGKEPCCPLNRRLDVSHSWYGHFGDEKNSLVPVRFEPWIIHPSQYTDYTSPAPEKYQIYVEINMKYTGRN
jgi:hypothetical protein